LQNDAHVTILADYMKMQAQDPLGLAGTGSNLVAFDASKSTGYTQNITGLATPTSLYTPPGGSINPTRFLPYVNNIPSVSANPKAAPVAAFAANTRVYRENTQIGVSLDYELNANNALNLVFYGGHRNNSQFLSTTTTPYFSGEGTPRPKGCDVTGTDSQYCGKNSTISRDFVGLDFSWANSGTLFDHQYKVVSGLTYAYMSDARKDVGTGNGVIQSDVTAGREMNLNRLETDNSFNLDEYVQGQLTLNNQLDLHAGIRNVHSMMIFNPTLPNKGGNTSYPKAQWIKYSSTQFDNTTPSIGLVWKVQETTNIYADYGKGFQTPNSIQMAYAYGSGTNTAGLGPNTGLSGSTSDNFELGIKSFINPTTRLNAAIFRVVTANEIEIASGGAYTVYRNITSDTTRNGFEASISSQLVNNFDLYGAYTYMDATFGGNMPNSDLPSAAITSGNKIPGIAKNQFYGEASWSYPAWGFRTALESLVNSRIYANDTNKAYANGYAIANLRATFEQKVGNWRLSEFARIENIFDRDYIGAVRINDSNGMYYEAGAGWNYMAGVSATYQF
jgi:iron complex outermembrane receptor protein